MYLPSANFTQPPTFKSNPTDPYKIPLVSQQQATKNIAPQCSAYQKVQKQLFHAPRVTAEALLEKSLEHLVRGSSWKLLFWNCSRGSKSAGRGANWHGFFFVSFYRDVADLQPQDWTLRVMFCLLYSIMYYNIIKNHQRPRYAEV